MIFSYSQLFSPNMPENQNQVQGRNIRKVTKIAIVRDTAAAARVIHIQAPVKTRNIQKIKTGTRTEALIEVQVIRNSQVQAKVDQALVKANHLHPKTRRRVVRVPSLAKIVKGIEAVHLNRKKFPNL